MDTFIFNRNELNLLDFWYTEDDDYIIKHGTVDDFVAIPWLNINNLDFGIVMALQEVEEENILIDQTK